MFLSIQKLAPLALAALTTLALGSQPAAETPVSKSQREALVFIADLSQGSPAQQAFYDFVEFGARSLAQINLAPNYNLVTFVEGASATRARLSDRLRDIAAKSNVRAVDLFFVTHGLSGSVKFSDQTVSMTTLRNDITSKLSTSQRAKLRMVFSTACFGSSHNTSWLQAGFKVASGSRRIYADSAVSYLPFLVAWANGSTFSSSVAVANAADVGNAVDEAAKVVLFFAGLSNWFDVDSHRLIAGSSGLRISTMP